MTETESSEFNEKSDFFFFNDPKGSQLSIAVRTCKQLSEGFLLVLSFLFHPRLQKSREKWKKSSVAQRPSSSCGEEKL